MEEREERNGTKRSSESDEDMGSGRSSTRGDLGSPVVPISNQLLLAFHPIRREVKRALPDSLFTVNIGIVAPSKVTKLPVSSTHLSRVDWRLLTRTSLVRDSR